MTQKRILKSAYLSGMLGISVLIFGIVLIGCSDV
jgi:hypothetical protein